MCVCIEETIKAFKYIHNEPQLALSDTTNGVFFNHAQLFKRKKKKKDIKRYKKKEKKIEDKSDSYFWTLSFVSICVGFRKQ